MKKILLAFLCFVSVSCFAFAPSNTTLSTTGSCGIVQPWPATDPNAFCNQFEEIAYCQCQSSSGMPYKYCKEQLKMKGIYKSLISKFGDLSRACIYAASVEPRTTKELCEAQWQLYLSLRPI